MEPLSASTVPPPVSTPAAPPTARAVTLPDLPPPCCPLSLVDILAEVKTSFKLLSKQMDKFEQPLAHARSGESPAQNTADGCLQITTVQHPHQPTALPPRQPQPLPVGPDKAVAHMAHAPWTTVLCCHGHQPQDHILHAPGNQPEPGVSSAMHHTEVTAQCKPNPTAPLSCDPCDPVAIM
jgi:hypothetical protein